MSRQVRQVLSCHLFLLLLSFLSFLSFASFLLLLFEGCLSALTATMSDTAAPLKPATEPASEPVPEPTSDVAASEVPAASDASAVPASEKVAPEVAATRVLPERPAQPDTGETRCVPALMQEERGGEDSELREMG